MIRPLPELKRSFEFVLKKYNRTKDYRYICDQLKAIRQDLTVMFLYLYKHFFYIKHSKYYLIKVQMIQNEFTIEVYETHARIAIKNVNFLLYKKFKYRLFA